MRKEKKLLYILNNSKVPSYYRVLQLERVPSNALTMISYAKSDWLIRESKKWRLGGICPIYVCVGRHYYAAAFFLQFFETNLRYCFGRIITLTFWYSRGLVWQSMFHRNTCIILAVEKVRTEVRTQTDIWVDI